MLSNGHELGTFKKKERQVSMSTVAKEERWVGEVDNEMGPESAVITQWIRTHFTRQTVFNPILQIRKWRLSPRLRS